MELVQKYIIFQHIFVSRMVFKKIMTDEDILEKKILFGVATRYLNLILLKLTFFSLSCEAKGIVTFSCDCSI